MKKIAFFVQWMLCGGVENTLITLSDELAKRGHDVTIYVILDKGKFINKIPSNVQLKKIPMNEKIRKNIPVGGTKVSIRQCVERKRYVQAMKFFVKHFIGKSEFAELNTNFNKIPHLDEKYDIAVNYHMHSPFLVRYLSEKVDAKVKYTWIHNDFKTTGYNVAELKRYFECVDNFFAVAEKLADEFKAQLPEYSKRTQVALNMIPVDKIINKSEEFYPKEFKEVNQLKILTVGCLEERKGYDIAIAVCEKLVKSNVKFQWFVLGEGSEKKILNEEIRRKGVQEHFHFLGAKMNPYPYFRYCDIYVQTSRHEGYVTTVSEAKIFNKPILTTDVSGAREQLEDGKNGSIASINVDSVYEKLMEIITSETIRRDYTLELKKEKKDSDAKWITFFD